MPNLTLLSRLQRSGLYFALRDMTNSKNCKNVPCATDETKLWLSPSAKQRRNHCSGSPPVYQDLSTRHDWPIRKPLPICLSGWKEIRNPFPVFRWIRWVPKTRMWALVRRRYLPRLKTSVTQVRKMELHGWQLLFDFVFQRIMQIDEGAFRRVRLRPRWTTPSSLNRPLSFTPCSLASVLLVAF